MSDKYLCGLYKITNVQNGKFYIGSSNNIKRRWQDHKKKLRYGKHANKHLQSAWDKYKEGSFTFEQILICEPKDLLMYEQSFLDFFKCYDSEIGYNLCASAVGKFQSEETKKKLSDLNRGKSNSTDIHKEAARKAHLGKPKSPEAIAKRTETRRLKKKQALEGGIEYGARPWTEERREKTKGRKMSPEQVEFMRQLHKGKKKDPESIKKAWETKHKKYEEAELNGEFYGASKPESREKNRVAHTGLKQSEETVAKRIAKIKSNPEKQEESKLKREETRRFKKEQAEAEGRIYGAKEWTPEHREKIMKARAEKKRLRDEAKLLESQNDINI